MLQQIVLGSTIIFVALMFFIGYKSSKQAGTVSGFLLGGRNVGAWMSAFAYGTSYFSAVIFIGYAGKTGWGIGLGGVWVGIGNALLGSLLAWLVLAKRTRRMTNTLGAATMPEFFSARYISDKLKVFSAFIIFIFLLPYAASVYMGLGYLFNAIFPNVSYVYCMLFIAALTSVYLVMGGYVATVVTDFVQGIIMVFGVIVMTFCIVQNPAVGGVGEGLRRLSELPGGGDLVHIFGGTKWPQLLSLVLLTSLGTWGLPQMVHKFYAIKDEKSIVRATWISTLFALLIGSSAYFIGIFGRLYLNNTLPMNGTVVVWDKIVPDMLVMALTGGVWSAVVLSVILLLVLSASMSTLSAVVLTASSAVAVDVLKVFHPKVDPKKQMIFLRGLCLLFAFLSFLFASLEISFIIALMSFSWGMVSGCFIGPYVWGLYWKGTTRAGAWAGMFAGALVELGSVVYFTVTHGFASATANSPQIGVCAMLASLVVVPIVSKMTKPFDKKHIDAVYGV